jgi:hypothetical protein
MRASRGDCESVVERRSIGPDVCECDVWERKKLIFFRRAKASVADSPVRLPATFQVPPLTAFYIQYKYFSSTGAASLSVHVKSITDHSRASL